MNFISYVMKLIRSDCSRESTLRNLSKNPSNDSYTKDSVRTSRKNMDLDGPFNHIIGYLNINSLRNKIDDLRKVFKNVQIDILCIDETKLDDSFPDIQFKINGYQSAFLRRDRDNRGGKIIFIKPSLIVTWN